MGGRTMVALFSGINVGGNRMVRMADLRELLEGLGLESVATYVQSGNAVFRAGRGSPGEVAREVEKAFERRFGFSSRVMVRDGGWIREVVDQNPFAAAADDPKKLHVFVLEHPPAAADADALAGKNTGTERFLIRGDALYLWTPDGLGRSKFAERIPRTLQVAVTASNWRTMLALLGMCEAAEPGTPA